MAKKVTKTTEAKKAAPRAKQSRAKTKATIGAAAREASDLPSPTEEQIRARAYEVFRRGANPSDPVADWFQAEQELRGIASL